MTKPAGSVTVTGYIAPSDENDTYASHSEEWGRGGWRTVADITARNAITSDRRKIGMLVRVLDARAGSEKFYTLAAGIDNANWVEQNFGGGAVAAEDVTYDNSTSGLTATDAQAAIDEIVATAVYTNANPIPSTIGGWAAGSTFTGLTMQEMWDGLLYPYQTPAFSSFSISGQATSLEVGDSIGTNKTFTWGTTNSGNVKPNVIGLVDVTGGVTIASGLANDGTETTSYPASPITKTSATSHSFRVDGTNTHEQVFSRTFSVIWYWLRFYGESVNAGPLSESDIEGLRVSGLASGFAATYSFSGGGYKYIAYPSVFGTATMFKDSSTNLDIPFETAYTVSVTNSFGVMTTYRVHRSTNIMGGAVGIVVS